MDSQVDFWTSKNSQISGGVAVMVPTAAPPTAERTYVPASPVVAPSGGSPPFAGSLPTPEHYEPRKLPAMPCLRRWSPDEVRTKLHEPIDAMRARRGLPKLTDDQKRKLVGEYVLRKVVGVPTITERAPGISPPAGNGGGAGECGGDTAAAGGDAAAGGELVESAGSANLIPICGSLAYWLDPYGKWHCCECDPWKGKPGGPGSKMCRGYHVVDRVPVGCEVNGVAAKRFVMKVHDEGGQSVEMAVEFVDCGVFLVQ